MPDIFAEADKCNQYAVMNNGITGIKSGDIIQAFIKNVQEFGIFCSLNLGYSGFISHKKSKEYILQNNRIGDIMDVVVTKIEEDSSRVFLKLCFHDQEPHHAGYPQESMNIDYENYDEVPPEMYDHQQQYDGYQQSLSYYDQFQSHLPFEINSDFQFHSSQMSIYENQVKNFNDSSIVDQNMAMNGAEWTNRYISSHNIVSVPESRPSEYVYKEIYNSPSTMTSSFLTTNSTSSCEKPSSAGNSHNYLDPYGNENMTQNVDFNDINSVNTNMDINASPYIAKSEGIKISATSKFKLSKDSRPFIRSFNKESNKDIKSPKTSLSTKSRIFKAKSILPAKSKLSTKSTSFRINKANP